MQIGRWSLTVPGIPGLGLHPDRGFTLVYLDPGKQQPANKRRATGFRNAGHHVVGFERHQGQHIQCRRGEPLPVVMPCIGSLGRASGTVPRSVQVQAFMARSTPAASDLKSLTRAAREAKSGLHVLSK